MRHYTPGELETFLRAIDAALEEPTTIVVIGGSAASLAYGFERATQDIDTLDVVSADLERAAKAARKSTGLDLPVSYASVADYPYHCDTRLRTVPIDGLEKLTVVVPEAHDLVLMKLVRAYEHDLEAMAAIHENHGLDFEVLVERYIKEMNHAIGDRRRLDLNFLAGIERVFPTRVDEAERTLSSAARMRGTRS